jgi:hypothetical protein
MADDGLLTSVVGGILLPVEVLQSEFFAVLATFVAINTLIYVTLAIAKMLPRIHPSDLVHRRDRRRLPRGIDAVPGRGPADE